MAQISADDALGWDIEGDQRWAYPLLLIFSGVALGVSIGVAIGAATDDMALWLSLGAAIGAGLGVALSAKPKRSKSDAGDGGAPVVHHADHTDGGDSGGDRLGGLL